MKALVKKREIEITLIINDKEALWLKGLVQNPAYGFDYESEPEEHKHMRKKFWDALECVKLEGKQ